MQVTIEQRDLDLLDAEAALSGLSRTELIRIYVRDGLDRAATTGGKADDTTTHG